MAFATIDVTKGITGTIATDNLPTIPTTKGGTGLTSGFKNGVDPRPNTEPLFINGNMEVAQRGTSETGQTGSGHFTCDRWGLGNTSLGTYTIEQSTDAPDNTGLGKSYKLDCTTADASPSAGDRLYFYYQFEGQEVQLLEKGTSDAKKSTLAFWVKSAKTGTYTVQAYDNDNSRAVSVQYTISSANTWEHKVLVIPADTSGAYDNDNASSLIFLWYLGAGSTRTSGTLQTSWGADVAANTAVGNVNLSDSTSNDWYITGVQLEVGEFTSTTLPPFQHETLGDNLLRCQRYFWRADTSTNARPFCMGRYWSADNVGGLLYYPVKMRTAPTVTWVNPTNGWLSSGGTGSSNDYFTDIVTDAATTESVVWYTSGTSADGTAGYGTIIYTGTGGGREMNCNAEL